MIFCKLFKKKIGQNKTTKSTFLYPGTDEGMMASLSSSSRRIARLRRPIQEATDVVEYVQVVVSVEVEVVVAVFTTQAPKKRAFGAIPPGGT